MTWVAGNWWPVASAVKSSPASYIGNKVEQGRLRPWMTVSPHVSRSGRRGIRDAPARLMILARRFAILSDKPSPSSYETTTGKLVKIRAIPERAGQSIHFTRALSLRSKIYATS